MIASWIQWPRKSQNAPTQKLENVAFTRNPLFIPIKTPQQSLLTRCGDNTACPNYQSEINSCVTFVCSCDRRVTILFQLHGYNVSSVQVRSWGVTVHSSLRHNGGWCLARSSFTIGAPWSFLTDLGVVFALREEVHFREQRGLIINQPWWKSSAGKTASSRLPLSYGSWPDARATPC